MTLLIDPPNAPGHGRMWSHLASDTSFDELHVFAARLGIPRRGFERDHYDVPGSMYDQVVAAGATPVSSRDLVARLTVAGMRRRKKSALTRRKVGRPLLRPPRLRPGDTVAVTGPAGPAPPDRLAAGVAVISSWDLSVKSLPSASSTHPSLGYLAASDELRAVDLMQAWCDPAVRAVFCSRGGYGVQRMVDELDFESLAEAGPKILVGFSDITALHQAFASRLGLATVHGPVVTSLAQSAPSAAALHSLLFGDVPASLGGLASVVGGMAEGVLVGGNLSLLAASLGTRDSRPAARSIAVLEDVNEDAFRVDRLLTQLLRAGWFDDVEGIVVGDFTDCGDAIPVLVERLAPLGVPLVTGAPVGHGESNIALPLGIVAVLDADAGTLALSQPLA